MNGGVTARSSTKDAAAQSDLFAAKTLPEGFTYRPDAVPAVLEKTLLPIFATLPFQPFDFHGFLGNRRVVSYGWRYDYGNQALRESDPMPDFLLPLREIAGAFAGLPPERFEQSMVIEYAPGAGIGWHRDKPMFEDVVAFSFLAPCRLRFRRKAGGEGPRKTWARADQELAPGSVYLLRGPAREIWEHSIPALTELRYSVTFRNFKPKGSLKPKDRRR
jgi:alkylated DNA repair dioxygenase AlkB